MFVANFSMPVLLYFGNFSASKFHIKIKINGGVYERPIPITVLFCCLRVRISFKTKIKCFTKLGVVPKMLKT